ncbi:MAG: prepilin-type N-terminal cleavage/methylation domain-containing protein [Candidatus Pacebacteria bacterium]|nr:prepilin-type N-terminal cleavage/methylation domain-containing protein [Candidatus Paceibacterota bacterium]
MNTGVQRIRPKHPQGGFSMIELVVSVGILVVITLVVLVNYAAFGGSVLIGSLAYDVGLSIRQAQVFGLSVREFGFGSGQFDVGYGVHFDMDSPQDYFIYADLDKNYIYNADDGAQEVFNIGRGFSIKRVCVTTVSSTELCSDTDNINVLDITFVRPDPDAYIRVDGDAGTVYQSARVVVGSPQGAEREVTVESTGQISVVPGS